MKTTELRIGNIVKTKESDYFSSKGITEVKSIGYNSINTFDDGRVSMKNDLSNISGLPLTEELLLKMGFIKKAGRDGWNFTKNKFELGITSTFFLQFGIDTRSSVAIYFVHQLQNIYFDLTNEELTVIL
jgi:hypothetical protein